MSCHVVKLGKAASVIFRKNKQFCKRPSAVFAVGGEILVLVELFIVEEALQYLF